MKIQTLSIQNFKAFGPEQRFDFDAKNVLIYGNNGAGKSSVYYALHAFMQSSSPGKNWQKYFDPTHVERLTNAYTDHTQVRSFVRLTAANDQVYELSASTDADALPSVHADISLANLASDFMNYRLLFNFYNFRNSTDADIWDVFEKEIFPYWTYDPVNNISFEQRLTDIRRRLYDLSQLTERNAETYRINHIGAKQPAYKTLLTDLIEFNTRFNAIFRVLEPDIQTLLSTYFLPDESTNVHIELQGSLAIRPKNKYELDLPVLRLTLTVKHHNVARPQTFLNEARLTAVALSIRLAMVGQKFKGIEGRDDLRILVLDDLLISLDMANRMKVIKYLQTNPDFRNYQLIILTHDKGFYERVRAVLAPNHDQLTLESQQWKFFEMFESSAVRRPDGAYTNPVSLEKADYLKKAEDLLDQHDLDGCALYLRKKLEQLLCIYYDPTLENLSRYAQMKTLFKGIAGVKKDTEGLLASCLLKIASRDTLTSDEVEKLKALEVNREGLIEVADKERVGKINKFHKNVFNFFGQYYSDKANIQKVVNEMATLCTRIDEVRGLLLNKGAHHGEEPLYEAELRDACRKTHEFMAQLFVFKKQRDIVDSTEIDETND